MSSKIVRDNVVGVKAMTEPQSKCVQLLELATPRLYRRNPFRVLGVPITITLGDAQRLFNRRIMKQKLSVTKVLGASDVQIELTEEDTRTALAHLKDPVYRFLEELFWYWSEDCNSQQDEGVAAALKGRMSDAERIWLKRSTEAPLETIAEHNLAVMYHSRALDEEAISFSSNGNGHHDQLNRPSDWKSALEYWGRVLKSETCWAFVRERVRILDDLRLTTGFARRVRSTLPRAIVAINGQLAQSAAERMQAELVNYHLGIMRSANFAEESAEEAILELVEPLRNKLKAVIAGASQRWQTSPHLGNQVVQEMHKHGSSLLETANLLLPAHSLVCSELRDKLAEAILLGQIAYANATDGWEQSLPVLELASSLAVSEGLKDRLQENLKIMRGNIEFGNAWHAANYWELPNGVTSQLEDARKLAEQEDYAKAIQLLVAMDPNIGEPIRRCLAHVLRDEFLRQHGEATERVNQPTKTLAVLWEKIEAMADVNGNVLVPRSPDPDTHVYARTPCLLCGRTDYTQWQNFTFRNVNLWWCVNCNQRDDREAEQRKSDYSMAVARASEYLALAAEVDPKGKRIREDFEIFKERLRGMGLQMPDGSQLRNCLAVTLPQGRHVDFDCPPETNTCFFCGKEPHRSLGIVVHIHGNVQTSRQMFGSGLSFEFGSLLVPRCSDCHRAHLDLTSNIERWLKTRDEVANYLYFRATIEDKRSRIFLLEEALKEVELAQNAVKAAAEASKLAQSIGTHCQSCGTRLDRSLCPKCDDVKGSAGRWTVMILLTTVVSWSVVLNLALPVLLSIIIFVLGIGLACSAIFWHVRKLKRRRSKRSIELTSKRSDAVQATSAETVLAEQRLLHAKQQVDELENVVREVFLQLSMEKRDAVRQFEQSHPFPTPANGMRAEEDFVSFPPLVDLIKSNWKPGHDPKRAIALEEATEGLVSPNLGARVLESNDALMQSLSNYNGSKEQRLDTSDPETANTEERLTHESSHYAPNLDHMSALDRTPANAPASESKIDEKHEFNLGGVCIKCGCSRGAILHFGFECKSKEKRRWTLR